jgi:hypothetical protein
MRAAVNVALSLLLPGFSGDFWSPRPLGFQPSARNSELRQSRIPPSRNRFRPESNRETALVGCLIRVVAHAGHHARPGTLFTLLAFPQVPLSPPRGL